MTVSMKQLYEEIITKLRNDISDPLNRSEPWILPDYPEAESSYPRISVLNVGLGREGAISVGEETEFYAFRFEIAVWCKIGEVVNFKGIQASGAHLRELIAGEIFRSLRDKDYFEDKGVFEVELISESVDYDRDYNLTIKVMVFEFLVVR